MPIRGLPQSWHGAGAGAQSWYGAGAGVPQLWQPPLPGTTGGWGGVTLAYNVSSPEEVDEVIERAERAGATIGRRGTPTFWGGYSGVFIDPEGHPWEVAHNPFWTVDAHGVPQLEG